MKRIIVVCLFFFCLFAYCGCMKANHQNKSVAEEEKVETIGQPDQDSQDGIGNQYLVLTNGNTVLTKTAEFICNKVGAVHSALSNEWEKEHYERLADAEYILIGTNHNILEFEFSLRNCLQEEMLKGKKVSLFLIDIEEPEKYEEKILEWYPETELLPTFTMNSNPESFQEEMSRVNGWLTTVMTYDMKIQ